MPPSPLDDRVVVALSRPVRPQDLNLCLDSSYLGPTTPGSNSHPPVIATTVVSLKAANLTCMPSSSGSARSLNCGCSSASCCTVATYDKDSQAQAQPSTTGTTSGTSTSCPASQMVNSNENAGSLSPPGGVGSPVAGTPKQLASIKIIYPSDLAKKMTKCSKSHLPSQGPVIIDCRPFMEYNKSHIQGAVHINCADKISRRRLQQGKITVLDLISCREGKDSFKRIFSKEIIVYDENTNEPSRVTPSQPLHVVLESLKREGKEPLVLKGGLSGFKQSHENLCDNSLQLRECRDAGPGAHAAPRAPPAPASPDVEGAELTPVLPFLFLGNEQDAQDLGALQRLNVGYVLNVTAHLPLYHYDKGLLSYKRLPASDSSRQDLRQYFEEAFEFIGTALRLPLPARAVRSSPRVIQGCRESRSEAFPGLLPAAARKYSPKSCPRRPASAGRRCSSTARPACPAPPPSSSPT
nr:dual specificity protein phosphatase 10 isoform X2 [Microcebus murinus]